MIMAKAAALLQMGPALFRSNLCWAKPLAVVLNQRQLFQKAVSRMWCKVLQHPIPALHRIWERKIADLVSLPSAKGRALWCPHASE